MKTYLLFTIIALSTQVFAAPGGPGGKSSQPDASHPSYKLEGAKPSDVKKMAKEPELHKSAVKAEQLNKENERNQQNLAKVQSMNKQLEQRPDREHIKAAFGKGGRR